MEKMSKESRRRIMQANKSKDTIPELRVRKLLHHLGYRFRIHRKDLPGRPDIVLPRYRLVIFVHGCFWHQHPGCHLASHPKTREEFWTTKFAANKARDERNVRLLENLGWRVELIWECETLDQEKLKEKLHRFLDKQ
ncbi:MAG: DNA mismatch endonuclease Vsr [Bacteroidetes bacterium]|nr:MAG: DNA mismatch endonuclease Vsr [Bacteroidota bacterium]